MGKKLLSLITLFILCGVFALRASETHNTSKAFDHSLWENLLKEYVSPDGMVDYKGLHENWERENHPLKVYISTLEKPTKKEFNKWKRAEKMAFFINAYNAYTIALILDHYPVKSIKDIGSLFKGPWDKDVVKLFQTENTLNWIEHKVLRPVFKDARVHAAINCASIGCPKLQRYAFTGEKLDEQLTQSMTGFVNDHTRNKYDLNKKEAKVSEIFKWFKEDFQPDVKAYLLKYAQGTTKEVLSQPQVEIKYVDYDWKLNEKL